MPPTESLLVFPCDFTIKVFGLAGSDFEDITIDIVKRHLPLFDRQNIVINPSKKGKYVSLNITIHVDSKEQLDSIYQDLSSTPQVLMAL